MFVTSEEMVRTLVKERAAAVDCKGEYREWCRSEFRRVTRSG